MSSCLYYAHFLWETPFKGNVPETGKKMCVITNLERTKGFFYSGLFAGRKKSLKCLPRRPIWIPQSETKHVSEKYAERVNIREKKEAFLRGNKAIDKLLCVHWYDMRNTHIIFLPAAFFLPARKNRKKTMPTLFLFYSSLFLRIFSWRIYFVVVVFVFMHVRQIMHFFARSGAPDWAEL